MGVGAIAGAISSAAAVSVSANYALQNRPPPELWCYRCVGVGWVHIEKCQECNGNGILAIPISELNDES